MYEMKPHRRLRSSGPDRVSKEHVHMMWDCIKNKAGMQKRGGILQSGIHLRRGNRKRQFLVDYESMQSVQFQAANRHSCYLQK